MATDDVVHELLRSASCATPWSSGGVRRSLPAASSTAAGWGRSCSSGRRSSSGSNPSSTLASGSDWRRGGPASHLTFGWRSSRFRCCSRPGWRRPSTPSYPSSPTTSCASGGSPGVDSSGSTGAWAASSARTRRLLEPYTSFTTTVLAELHAKIAGLARELTENGQGRRRGARVGAGEPRNPRPTGRRRVARAAAARPKRAPARRGPTGSSRCWARWRSGCGVYALTELDLGDKLREVTLPLRHDDIIRQQAADKNLDPALIAAVIYSESRFRDQTSHAGARVDADHAGDGTDNRGSERGRRSCSTTSRTPTSTSPTDPFTSGICSGSTTETRLPRSPPTTRGGPGRRVGWGRLGLEDIQFEETRGYVEEVLGNAESTGSTTPGTSG